MLKPLSWDHIVLNVRDVERSINFYHEILALEIDMPRYEAFKRGKSNFASVRVNADAIIDLFPKLNVISPKEGESGNLNHFAIAFERFDMNDFVKFATEKGVKIVRGPVNLAGAKGPGDLVNILDPDGNSIEVRHY